MTVEREVVELRERMSEVEHRLDQVFAHLGLEAPSLPGTKAATVSPEVRALIADYRIIDAMKLYSEESDGARDLDTAQIAAIFKEETGQEFEAKRAR